MPISLQDEFWSKVKKRSKNDCWIWLGAPKPNGYGRFYDLYVHRVVYEMEVAKIPKNMTIDHLCRVKLCVNPIHLEVVSRRENTLRGETVSGINSRKTHCNNGHKLSGENLSVSKSGRRRCRICLALWRKENEYKTDRKQGINPRKAKLIPGKYHYMTPLNTHCVNGHKYTPETTMTYANSRGRQCRTCHNEQRRKGRR